MSQPSARIETLDCLRGIAVVGVCLYHFTNGNGAFLPQSVLKSAGALGAFGVAIFFVISGFVLPLAMHRACYGYANFGSFVYKRLLRLEPPYLVAILFTLVVGSLAARVGGGDNQIRVTVPQLLLHFGYLNVFTGYDWINPVFWTLAIEFQFYFLIGLAFPLVIRFPCWAGVGSLLGVGVINLAVPHTEFVFHHWFLFLLGLWAFLFREGLMSRSQLFVLLVASLLVGGLTVGWPVIMAGAATAAAILCWVARNRFLLFKERFPTRSICYMCRWE